MPGRDGHGPFGIKIHSSERTVVRAAGTGQIRSMMVTLAWPPPSHMVSIP